MAATIFFLFVRTEYYLFRTALNETSRALMYAANEAFRWCHRVPFEKSKPNSMQEMKLCATGTMLTCAMWTFWHSEEARVQG